MKIALDVMGGDDAPDVNIIGARETLAQDSQIEHLYLVGQPAAVEASAQTHGLDLSDPRVSIAPATEVIGMGESATKAVRRKKNSSISVAVDLVKSGQAQAIVSAGNTGAVVTAAQLKLRLLKGVERAGIASPIPNEFGGCCSLLDAGANPGAKATHLLGYAIMGATYAREVFKVPLPTVGIMSNGEEEGKGNALTKETVALIRQVMVEASMPFDFIGNVEGSALFLTDLDVCITDGFTGNIVLKSCEATAKAVSKWLKEEFKRTPLRIAGAALARGAFRSVKERTSYESYGGSPLLGVNGVCIIAHGGSSALAIRNAIHCATEAIQHQVNPQIETALESLDNIVKAQNESSHL